MRIIISPAKQMWMDTDSFACTELPVFTDRAEFLSRSKCLTGAVISISCAVREELADAVRARTLRI